MRSCNESARSRGDVAETGELVGRDVFAARCAMADVLKQIAQASAIAMRPEREKVILPNIEGGRPECVQFATPDARKLPANTIHPCSERVRVDFFVEACERTGLRGVCNNRFAWRTRLGTSWALFCMTIFAPVFSARKPRLSANPVKRIIGFSKFRSRSCAINS